jgi:hypothetical protein
MTPARLRVASSLALAIVRPEPGFSMETPLTTA